MQMLSLVSLVRSFLIWSTFWFSGSASGNGTVSPFKTQIPISLKAGKNEIALLCMTVGLSVGYFYISIFYFFLVMFAETFSYFAKKLFDSEETSRQVQTWYLGRKKKL